MWMRALPEVTEEQAGEVSVHALVMADVLVAKGEINHKTMLFQPGDGGKGSGEENAFDCSEGNQSLGKC